MAGALRSILGLMHRPVYEARLRELVRRIVPHLRPGDRVLDVGCGSGALGRALLDAAGSPEGLVVEGLERSPRGGESITVHAYPDGGGGGGGGAGRWIPFDDAAYDVVIVADVLHHEAAPDRLLSQCARVAGRLLIIKDHQLCGPMARWRVSFMDWAANAPYGVACLYRYNTPEQWRRARGSLGMELIEELGSMNLYPPVVNLVFGRRLQYFAVLGRADTS